jgi:predicted  nucleic acid-binding Zn-ribbon protein
MQEEVVSLTRQIELSSKQNDDNMEVIRELQQSLQQRVAEKTDLADRHAQLEHYVRDLQTERVRLENEVKELEKSLSYDYDYTTAGQRQVSARINHVMTAFSLTL